MQLMDDYRTKYSHARRAKNQANYRAREERRNAEACRLAADYMRRRAAEANRQTTAAEREARAAREAAELKDRAIHSQLQRINELERQNGILRDQVRTALYRDGQKQDAAAKIADLECQLGVVKYWHGRAMETLAKHRVFFVANDTDIDVLLSGVPPMMAMQPDGAVTQAREATERAMARIEPHARPWWRRVFEWPKSDGGR